MPLRQIGGVRRDIDENDIPWIIKEMDKLIPILDMFKGAVLDDPVLGARLKGIGVLTKEAATEYGALGLVCRRTDLRPSATV